jgi:hypothetical protein
MELLVRQQGHGGKLAGKPPWGVLATGAVGETVRDLPLRWGTEGCAAAAEPPAKRDRRFSAVLEQ